MLTEELNRRGLAYVWGLMGLLGGLARIMIDSGNLVGDVVSEEFPQQAKPGRRTLPEGDRDCHRRGQDADYREMLPSQVADRGDRDPFRDPALGRTRDEERSQPGAAVPEPE